MRNRFDRLKREEMGEEEWQRAKEEERQGKPQSRWTQKEDDLLIKVSLLSKHAASIQLPATSTTKLTPTRQTPNYNAVPQEPRKSLEKDRQSVRGPDGAGRVEQALTIEPQEEAGGDGGGGAG